MKKIRCITIGVLFVLSIALGQELYLWTRGPTFFMFDVGQGDGILLSSGGYQIVVDGGPDGGFLSHLGNDMPFFDRTIDLLVLSHPHLDHLSTFPELVRRYHIASVLMTGVDYNQPRYKEFLELLIEEDSQILIVDPMTDLTLGDMFVDVLWPLPKYFGQEMKDVNDNSTLLLVSIPNGKSVLLTGDMEEGEERDVLKAGVDVRADILKVAHHGSRTSSGTGFLLAVNPELAIASVATDNSYGLPDEDVIVRYETLDIPLRMTMEEGTIEIPLR